MEPEYLIVLHSKYSTQCRRITSIHDELTMNYIKLVCIDNAKVRERLLKSKSIQVKTVPCVLLVYPNNKIEKFEGANVTDWIIKQITQNTPNTPNPPNPQNTPNPPNPQNTPQPTQPQNLAQSVIQPQTSVADLMDDGDQFSQNMMQPQMQPQQMPQIQRAKSLSEQAAEMEAERNKLIEIPRPTY